MDDTERTVSACSREEGHVEIVTLLERGADVNKADENERRLSCTQQRRGRRATWRP